MRKLLKRLITFCSQNLQALVRDDRADIRQLEDVEATRAGTTTCALGRPSRHEFLLSCAWSRTK